MASSCIFCHAFSSFFSRADYVAVIIVKLVLSSFSVLFSLGDSHKLSFSAVKKARYDFVIFVVAFI